MLLDLTGSLKTLWIVGLISLASCGGAGGSQSKVCGESFCVRPRSGLGLQVVIQMEDFATYRVSGYEKPVVIYEGNNPKLSESSTLIRSQPVPAISPRDASVFRYDSRVEVRISLVGKQWPNYLVLYSECPLIDDCSAVDLARDLVRK